MRVVPFERDDKIEPDAVDYKTACLIMADLDGLSAWSIPHVLAQYVATIRRDAKER